VQVAHVQAATGLDLSTRSPALKDVAWSTSVQHGPETNAIVKAMARVEATGVKPSDGQTYDRALINAIYDERGKRDASGALAYFTSASAQVQASVADPVRRRAARRPGHAGRVSRVRPHENPWGPAAFWRHAPSPVFPACPCAGRGRLRAPGGGGRFPPA
jgi:hypothetical protein